MKFSTQMAWAMLLLCCLGSPAIAGEAAQAGAGMRILSWNISGDTFVTRPAGFRSLLLHAEANVLLFDEVAPAADADQLRKVLAPPDTWHVSFGASGGRQRGVIASRMPLESLPEFSTIVPYPEAARQRIWQQMPAGDRSNRDWRMDGGIPVNGAVMQMPGRRLLVVTIDLQCCGNDPASWQELKRRVETRAIRELIRRVLDRTEVDGVVLAGDFNLVSTTIPLTIAAGPYRPPHSALLPVESYHLGSTANWTWDGRGSPFPSSALDYQLYSPQSLRVDASLVLDTEDLSDEKLELSGLGTDSSRRLSRHRPLVVEYSWR